MKSQYIFIFIILMNSFALAAEMKVIQTSKLKDQVLFELNGNDLLAGDIVSIGTCDAAVVQAGVLKGLVNTSDCRSREDIRVGDSVVLLRRGSGISSSNYSSDVSNSTKANVYTPAKPMTFLNKGFGVGLMMGSLGGKVDTDYTFESGGQVSETVNSENSATNMGAIISYSYIPNMNIGFLGKFNIYMLDSADSDAGMVIRPEANIAFGGDDLFYGYGGINFVQINDNKNIDSASPGVGFQVGFGVIFNKAFDIDFSYSMINFNSTSSGYDPGQGNYDAESKYALSAFGGSLNYRF